MQIRAVIMSVSINVNVNLYSASSQKNTPLMRSMCRVLFKEERIQHASSAWINIGNGKCYSSCWVRQLPENTQASGPCADNPWCSEPSPNSVGFEDYYCAKFHVIPIRGFRFIVLTYTPTHTHIQYDKVIALSTPPYYSSAPRIVITASVLLRRIVAFSTSVVFLGLGVVVAVSSCPGFLLRRFVVGLALRQSATLSRRSVVRPRRPVVRLFRRCPSPTVARRTVLVIRRRTSMSARRTWRRRRRRRPRHLGSLRSLGCVGNWTGDVYVEIPQLTRRVYAHIKLVSESAELRQDSPNRKPNSKAK